MATDTFIWGAGGQKLTPSQAKARRARADAMLSNPKAADTFGGGLAAIGQALQGVALDRQATDAEAAHAVERQAIMDGLMGISDPSLNDIYSALGNETVSSDPTSMAILNALIGDEQQQAQWARQDALTADERAYNAERLAEERAYGQPALDADIAFKRAQTDALLAKPAVPLTDDQREYQMAVEQGYDGTFMDYVTGVKKAGATTVNVGGEAAAPGLGKLSTDFGYVVDPVSREPVVDPQTGLPRAAPIPGSPAAIEAERLAAAATANNAQTGQTADIVREDIERIKGIVSDAPWYSPAVGFGSGMLQMLEGSNATNVAALSETVRANIGFDRLQAMREASPTGGALGQVTERELSNLQAVMGNLSQSQSVDQFLYNLDRLGELYDGIQKKAAAYPNASQFGFTPAAPSSSGQSGAAPAGNVDDILKEYGL